MIVVANRYARAFIEALAPESTQAGLDQLRRFAVLLEDEPDTRTLLMNPVIPAESRDRFLDTIGRVLGLDRRVRKLLLLLVDRRRLNILDDLTDAYQKLLDERNGIVRAEVSSASLLTESERRELAERLGKTTGKRVEMEVEQDPSLIGGLVVRIGSTVYDGSLRQQLRGFKERLTN
jgi:F-type H+-transporting ATPase subunit delta